MADYNLTPYDVVVGVMVQIKNRITFKRFEKEILTFITSLFLIKDR